MYHHQPNPGTLYLAVALGIGASSGQIDAQSLDKFEFLGELALTGELRGVDGVLPAAIAVAGGGRSLIVAAANSEERPKRALCGLTAAECAAQLATKTDDISTGL